MSAKKKIRRVVRLNVKFAGDIKQKNLDQILSGVAGLRSAIQLFLDETEEEMLSHLKLMRR